MKINLSSPDITNLERDAVIEVLNTPNLSLGPKIRKFEKKFEEYVGVKNAVAMSSGTAVLHIIIKALGIGKGDYVLTTPFSFISTANCLLFENAIPIFVDINQDTYNLDPQEVEIIYLSLPKTKRNKVKAIIYVDVFGVPADGIGFEKLGQKYNLKIIEDSAEALCSSFKERRCGSFGDAGLFAFYPNKQITTGEGGILVTNNEDIAKLARSYRNQGRDKGTGWLQHARLGYNYRISDINCAIGIAQMKRIDEIIGKRRKVKKLYDNLFKDMFNKGLLIPQRTLEKSFVSPFVYVLRLSDKFNKEDRGNLLCFLRKNGIQCSNYFSPIHLQPHYKKLGWKYGDMPITEKVSEKTVAFPFYNNLKRNQIEYVVENVNDFFRKFKHKN